MTNKEAAEVLKIIHTDENGIIRKPLEMAIKALEKEPCEDCISRKDTLKKFKQIYFDNDTVIRCAELILGSMPPVTPQPKTGHWIAVENEEMETVGYYCSECDLPMETEQRTNFCPNCGTKMIKPQESEYI